MTDRTPSDGEPFYCDICGLGLQEVMACEDGICWMESAETARARQLRASVPTVTANEATCPPQPEGRRRKQSSPAAAAEALDCRVAGAPRNDAERA